MRIIGVGCVLACLLAAPAAAQRKQPSAADLKVAFVLHVRDGGLLQLPGQELLTLREILARITKVAAEFDPEKAANQQALCDMPIVIHVEPMVPWHHVQTVMRLVAQLRCHRIWLAREKGEGVEYHDVSLPLGSMGVYVKTDDGLVEIAPRRFPIYLVRSRRRRASGRSNQGRNASCSPQPRPI